MAPAALTPFRSRSFALLWSAAAVSNVGTWVQGTALSVFVTVRTHRPGWTALVAAAAFLPMGLMAPVGGVLADRLDRKRFLLVTTLGETLAAVALAVGAAHRATPLLVYVLIAFLGGSCSAVGFPAFQAMIPDLVERSGLLSAIGWFSAQFNLGRIVGPAISGVLILGGHYSLAFTVNAISFAGVFVALLLVRPVGRESFRAETPAGGAAAGIVGRMREGFVALRDEPACLAAVVAISVVAVLASPFIALIPSMVVVVLGRSGASASALVTAQGVGAVVGAVALPALARRFTTGRVAVTALHVVPVLLVAYAASPNLVTATVALGLVGFGYIGILTGLNMVMQLRAPEASRGRILSTFMFSLGILYPIGSLIQGALGNVVGLRWVTGGAAVGLLVAVRVARRAFPGQAAALLGVGAEAAGAEPVAELPLEPVEPGTAPTGVDPAW